MRSLLAGPLFAAALLLVPVLASAQDSTAVEPPAGVDAAALAELSEQLGTPVSAHDARTPLASLSSDGLFAVHIAPEGLTLYASLLGGRVADWVTTDTAGRLGGVQPVTTASGSCWACGGGGEQVVCWQVTCTIPREVPEDEVPQPDVPEDGAP